MVTYESLHWRVGKARGKPERCEVCGVSGPGRIYDWANLTGDYENVMDFKRMCRPCHSKYDRGRRPFGYVNPRAYKFKAKAVQLYIKGVRFGEICEKYDIGTTTLARWVRGLKQNINKVDIRRSLSLSDERQLCAMYSSGKSSTFLAKYFEISERTALETLRRYGIDRRPRGTPSR